MRNLAGNIICAFLILAFTPGVAGAVPHAWESSEAVVRVLDLPDKAAFRRSAKVYMDLGYQFHADGSGRWVGYRADGFHENLDAAKLGMALAAAGMSSLPPLPQRPLSLPAKLFLGALGLLALGGMAALVLAQRKEDIERTVRMESMLTGQLAEQKPHKPVDGGISLAKRAAERKAARKEKKRTAQAVMGGRLTFSSRTALVQHRHEEI